MTDTWGNAITDVFRILFRPQARGTGGNGIGAQRTVVVPLNTSGVRVDYDSCMTYSAVFAAVRVIAEGIATLPWRAYAHRPDGGRDSLSHSTLDYLLHVRPNPEMSPFDFKQAMVAWALTWGNGYAEIERDAAGRPMALWPITPDRVEVKRSPDGELVYEVSCGRGGKVYLPAGDVFHLHGLGFDGITGYSVIGLASCSIGLGIAAEEFGSSFFANGSVLSGVLTHPQTLGDEAYERLKESWAKEHGRGPRTKNKPAILEEGMKWEQLGIPPEQAQFLETRKFNISEIARWFRVPPHMLADLERATFSNIEHQSMEYLRDTLLPWCVRLEQEADHKLVLPKNRGKVFTKFSLNALMRADAKSRAEFYKIMREMGAFSANDILQLEDMNPIGPEGDKRIVQMNFTTLEKVGEEPEQPEPAPSPNVADVHRITVEDACRRVLARERHRAEDAMRRYGEDRTGLASCLDKFYAQHRQYMAEALQPSLDALLFALTGAQKECPADIINSIADQHIQESREIIFAGQLWDDDRVPGMAANLIDQATRIATVQGRHHEDQDQQGL